MTQAERNTELFEYIADGTWIGTFEILLKRGANVNTQKQTWTYSTTFNCYIGEI